MDYQVRCFDNATWICVDALSPYDAIQKLFKVHTIYLKKQEGFDVYVTENQAYKFFVNKLKRNNK